MYSKKIDANTAHLIVVLCIRVVSLTTIACSGYSPRYNMHTKAKKIDATKRDQDKEYLDKSRLFQVNENHMTLFCKAIKERDYTELIKLLKEIEYPDTTICDDVIYLITGYGFNKKGGKQYPKRALLDQVITSFEDEMSEYTYTEKLLDKLFEILRNYNFDLEKAFFQKHGKDENTIMHLAVNTGSLAIVKCLAGWYPKKGRDNDHFRQMIVCSIPNHSGETPLSMLAKGAYHHPFICGRHEYDRGCETCDHTIEMKTRREDILLYLLKLGVPWLENTASKIKSVLHYCIKHDAGDFFIEMIEAIQQRAINKYRPEDLVSLKDKKGNTLLFYAVRCRDYRLAEYLLALGACPMQFNHKGSCPMFCAIAFRDIKMVKSLSKARCILERICNINEPSSNGLTAQDLAKLPDGGGMCPLLENYCNRFKEKYGTQILPNEWSWKPNDQIEQLVLHLCNYFTVKKIKKPNLIFHARLGRNCQSGKRSHTDASNARYGSSTSMNQNKRSRILL